MTARVVMLTTNLARGGAEAQVAMLASGLRRRGWETAVVSLVRPTAFEQELTGCGVQVLSLGMQPGVPGPLGAARLASILRKRRPQVLHSHMFHANLLARIIRTVCPVPVLISTLHSVAESGRVSRSTSLRDWAYRITDPLADMTVAVSEAVAARHAAAKAVRRLRLRVLPNGIDTCRFRPDPEARARVRQELGISGFAWLAVGRLMWKKDYPALLRGFSMLPQRSILCIAGAGPQERELQSLAVQLGVDARFLGERADVAGLLPAFDGFVLSSVVEGLPMALLEAAAAALPAVVTDVGGAREVVLDGRTGFVVRPSDPDALAAALGRVMRLSPERLGAIGRAAREHVVSRFDIQAVVTAWEGAYAALLEQAQAAAGD
jgi:glycosyltransferase involved in cell wall biosynthesis